jgi:hypothetical protein
MVAVDVAVEGAECGADHALQWMGAAADEGHVPTEPPRRRRDFGPDPPRAHDDHVRRRVQRDMQSLGVCERPKHMDAWKVTAADAQRASRRTGREQQAVVFDAAAVIELQCAPADVQRLSCGSCAQLDVMGVVPLRVVNDHFTCALGALQKVLRQRRALVRRNRLVSHEHDAAVEALVAQGLDREGARETGPDDDDPLRGARDGGCHAIPPRALKSMSATLEAPAV